MKKWRSELAQITSPYHSTVALEAFLVRHGCFDAGTEVLDVGTGIGAVLHYLRERHPDVRFLGTDYNAEKIRTGMNLIERLGADGIELETADWFDLPTGYRDRFSGVISVHAICCVKRIEQGMAPFFALNPDWIAINSLFHDGPIDVLVHIRNYENPDLADDDPDGDFNTFSLGKTEELFAAHGYEMIAEPFFPPEVIPRGPGGGRGTYTMRTEIHERTQFSGPVHLPWHFVLGRKIVA